MSDKQRYFANWGIYSVSCARHSCHLANHYRCRFIHPLGGRPESLRGQSALQIR
jgi:hypothetical protein